MKRLLSLLLLLPALAFGQGATLPWNGGGAFPNPSIFPGTIQTTGIFITTPIGPTSTFTPGTVGQNAYYGSFDLTGAVSNNHYAPMYFSMGSHGFVNTFSSPLTTVASFVNGVNGATNKGDFGGIESTVNVVATTANSTGGGGNYAAGDFVGQASVNDNGSGTGSNARGHLFGINPNVRLLNGATFWGQIVGEEIDIATATGASVNDMIGMQIVQGSNHAVAASRNNLGLSFNAGANSLPGWDVGVSFGANDGFWPMASTGTLIGCIAHNNAGGCGTTTNGIDFSNVTFTGNAFNTTGFSIDSAGNITGKRAIFQPTMSFTTTVTPTIQSPSSVSGTTTSGLAAYNTFNVNSDALNTTSGQGGAYDVYVGETINNASMTGHRTVVEGFASITGATGNGIGTNKFYTGVSGQCNATHADNGTSGLGNSVGNCFGMFASGKLQSGATFWNAVVGQEIDVGIDTGASALYDTGLQIVHWATNAVKGSSENVGLLFADQGGSSAPWDYLIAIGSAHGVFPVNGGTIMGTQTTALGGDAYSVAHGIDLSGLTCVTDCFKSTGFTVDGAGNISGKTITLAPGTALSQATWGVTGIGGVISAATFNDTTTGSGGVSQDAGYAFGPVTVTNTQGTANALNQEIGVYFGAPVCGSGWSACTNKYAIYSAGQIGGILGMTINGGPINLNVNSASSAGIESGTASGTLTLGGTTAGNNVNLASISTRFANVLYESATAPTINSHFNTSGDSITAASTAAFRVTVGTGGATNTGSLTFPAATTGWSCKVTDATTNASFIVEAFSTSTTAVTVNNYSRTTGAATNFTNSEKLEFLCGAY